MEMCLQAKRIMARLKCLCGNLLSNSSNPEIEYEVFNDEEMMELIDRSEKELGAALNYGGPKVSMWKCPNCKRLAIFEAHNDIVLQWYKPEKTNNSNW